MKLLTMNCKQCGEMFFYKKYPCDVRRSGKRKFCGRQCSLNSSDTKFKKGSNHPFYRTGTYISDNQIRRSFEYIKWQREVYKRDNFTCQICGGTNKLRANHIKRFSEYPLLRFRLNNGITICSSCDFVWVLRRENDWESYFNFNLMSRGFL